VVLRLHLLHVYLQDKKTVSSNLRLLMVSTPILVCSAVQP
jgi:hypothetical protein